MFEVIAYETPAGNKPIEKFLEDLAKQHKDDNIARIMSMINGLKEYGFELSKYDKGAISQIKKQIYELRPLPSRILFFYHCEGKFVLLHGFEKKCNKTPKEEIEKAEREKRDYLSSVKSKKKK